ncbi:hypothetical protein ACFPRL_02865 [Pseudoclavibacter helvolus]
MSSGPTGLTSCRIARRGGRLPDETPHGGQESFELASAGRVCDHVRRE